MLPPSAREAPRTRDDCSGWRSVAHPLDSAQDVVPSEGGGDTALLSASAGSRGVSFLSLGRAVGQTYRSVEVVSLASAIKSE